MVRSLPLLALSACLPFPRGEKVDLPDTFPVDRAVGEGELADEVERLVRELAVAERLPGVAVTLVDDGRVVYAGGFGWADIENGLPLTAETPVLLSSVSKTFVGVMAYQAVERGDLTLDEPAADLLGFPLDNPRVDGEVVTLQHLLTHNAGIEDSGEYDAHYASGDPTVDLQSFCEGYLVQGGAHWRPGNWSNRMPGDAFSYSNVGMACAASAIGQRVGRAPRELVNDILGPLGMSETAYFLEDASTTPAVPYMPAGNGVRPLPQYGYPTYPDGMIRSSAVDLGRYVAAMGNRGELDGERVLSEASWSAMVTVDPAFGTDEDGQAIAWAMRELDGRPLIGHNGGDFGSAAELWFDPETGDGFALAANGLPTAWSPILQLESDLMALVDPE